MGASGDIEDTLEGAELSDKNLDIARDVLTLEIEKAQAEVDADPAAPAAVALQAQLEAYKAAGDAANANVEKAAVAGKVFGAQNGEDAENPAVVTITQATNATDANKKPFHAEVSGVVIGDADAAKYTVVIDSKGKTTVYKAATSDVIDDTTANGLAAGLVADTTFKDLPGAAGVLASLQAVHGNIAAIDAATAKVQAAVISVLKAKGYTPKEEGAKWNQAKWVDGELTELDLVDKDEGGVTLTGALYTPAVINPVGGKVTGLDDAELAEGMKTVLGDLVDSLDGLAKAEGDLEAFNKAVDSWKELVSLQEQLEAEVDAVEAAAAAVAEAEEAFAELDVQLIKAEATVASGEVYDADDAEQLADLFVFQDSLKTVNNFDGNDKFYFGDIEYNLVVLGENETIEGNVGDVNAFDIFAVQDGVNTTLYVEQKAFAGNGSTDADLVEITLTGVNAADLSFADGFLTLA